MNKALSSANDRCLSDMHKDAFGVRPGPHQYALWNAMSDAELDEEEAYLHQTIQNAVREERETEARAVVEFEAYIAKLMNDHRVDRATAIRWDQEACGEVGSGYLYEHGLPWRYQLN